MKSDDPEVYEPAWRKFAISYWVLLEEDMEKELRKKGLPTSHAPGVALHAWKQGSANRQNMRAELAEEAYRYMWIIGYNYIRRHVPWESPLPEEDEGGEFESDAPEVDVTIALYVQAMDKTFANINSDHQAIIALAWAEALDILMYHMQSAYRDRIMIVWGQTFKYLLEHPEVLKRKEILLESLFELKPRHIAQILNLTPPMVSQTIMRIKEKYTQFLNGKGSKHDDNP